MPFFEAAMMGSMVISAIAGAATTGLNNSFGNVESSCKAKKEANDNLQKMKATWDSMVLTEDNLKDNIDNYKTDITEQARLTAAATRALKATYQETKKWKIIGLCVSIFMMIFFLLLKYFKIYERVWDLIMNSK
jgi:DMSO reductase anchor subunit